MVVKAYKKDFGKKYGSSRSPYIGQRREGSLSRWFKEKWVNQRGEVGYRYKSDVYSRTAPPCNAPAGKNQERDTSTVAQRMKVSNL
jgi:hypothetical protein